MIDEDEDEFWEVFPKAAWLAYCDSYQRSLVMGESWQASAQKALTAAAPYIADAARPDPHSETLTVLRDALGKMFASNVERDMFLARLAPTVEHLIVQFADARHKRITTGTDGTRDPRLPPATCCGGSPTVAEKT